MFITNVVRGSILGVALVHLCTVGLLTSAVAQVAKQPGFDPRQPEKNFDDRQMPTDQPARLPSRAPTVVRPDKSADARPLFVLKAVKIVDATALPLEQLSETYRSYLGKSISQVDLASITEAISDRYRAAGFHLSRAIAPAQDIEGGRIAIRVIEGSITEVSLQGDGADQFGIRPILDVVLSEHPSRLATLERQLLLANTTPGVRVADSKLEEIGGLTGRFRLVVSLKPWHVSTFVGIDNFGASTVGPWQTYAAVAFNSYLQPGDTLAVNLSTVANDPRQLGFARVSYDAPIGVDGVRLGGSAWYSEVRPGDVRRLYNDITTTEGFEIRGSIVPIQSQQSTLTITAAAGMSNVRERDIFGELYDDHIRTVSLTADYRLQDYIGGTNYATMSFRQGLDIFGASQVDDFVSRDGAKANFSVLNFYYSRYQALAGPFSAKLSAASQTAWGPLFTSQQFYLGAAAFGRGYSAAELSGDNGIAGSLEIRFDHSLDWNYLHAFQVYAFTDTGLVWNYGYHPWDGVSLTSAGSGIRLFFLNEMQADLSIAFPLSYRSPDNSWRDARLLFSLSSALKLCPQRGKGACL